MKIPYLTAENRYGKYLAAMANFFRQKALLVDSNPDAITQFDTHPAVQFILQDRDSTTVERTYYFEALAYGDPGVVLACPGPSLSGLILRELGTCQQIDDFFNFIAQRQAKTFFALTEPLKGSDAGALECRLDPDPHTEGQYILNGEKCLFGNGAVGKTGVVFARVGEGILGIRALWIAPELLDPDKGWIERQTLPMSGLRAARVAYMVFKNCPIRQDAILGNHLRPMEQGMLAIIKTFHRMRTVVGALAIGQAQGVLDFIAENKTAWNITEKRCYSELYYRLVTSRSLLQMAARTVDQNAMDGWQISIAKANATTAASHVINTALCLLPPETLLTNQWLAKCYRDSFAWEYMEGTRTMQFKNIHRQQANYLDEIRSEMEG